MKFLDYMALAALIMVLSLCVPSSAFAELRDIGGLNDIGGLGGLGSKNRWTRVDPYNVNDRKTITRDQRGNYTVTDPYDATYRREIRRTLNGGYVETDPFDATYRREWR